MNNASRKKSEELLEPDVTIENSLRPAVLDEFVGQNDLKENLTIFIEAAKIRNDVLDHTLFYGPPGLGKTTLAHIISKEMGSNMRMTSGPILSKVADLVAILTNLRHGDVLFIDEIHRLPIAVEEVLYSAMEDFRVDIVIGQGPAAKTIKIDINKFTLVGATTRLGLLSNPLRDRFGIVMHLSFYSPIELSAIVANCCNKLKFTISDDAAKEIGSRSRGTPRIAIRLTKRVLDIVSYLDQSDSVSCPLAQKALNKLGINSYGLDAIDLKYLNFINNNCNGGPVGIETLAVALSEDKNTIEEAIEPFLIQSGLVQKTTRGRVLTDFYKKSIS